MFSDLLARDRERSGLTIVHAARWLGVSVREYRLLEVGETWPSWETYDRGCELFGWPRSFVKSSSEQ